MTASRNQRGQNQLLALAALLLPLMAWAPHAARRSAGSSGQMLEGLLQGMGADRQNTSWVRSKPSAPRRSESYVGTAFLRATNAPTGRDPESPLLGSWPQLLWRRMRRFM